mgnify:CR=1 FL=1
MGPLKLNERIILLRKEKGITQEELAQALGVTNQAVSKWESAQCCPDIQLLPNIATFFDVSIDWLMGYRDTEISDNLPLQLRAAIDDAQAGDDAKLALKLVYMIHAILLSKKCNLTVIRDGIPTMPLSMPAKRSGDCQAFRIRTLPCVCDMARCFSRTIV